MSSARRFLVFIARMLSRRPPPQYFYQVALNGSRLGLYEPFRKWANRQLGYSPTQLVTLTSMGAGSVSAIVGCESRSFVVSVRYPSLTAP